MCTLAQRTAQLPLIFGLLLATVGPRAARGEGTERGSDCALGFLWYCAIESERAPGPPPSPVRVEAFGGYKVSNQYYRQEIRGCEAAGCNLGFQGAAFGLDAYYNVSGDPRSDDYLAVGLATSYVPIVSALENNERGFVGSRGFVEPGEGRLGYVTVRATARRGHFLYLIKSKYLVSSFGVGAAIPVASGAGASFTGADSVKVTLGGKLGADYPLTERLRLGIATNWSVVWFGSTFKEASFTSAYGLSVTFLL